MYCVAHLTKDVTELESVQTCNQNDQKLEHLYYKERVKHLGLFNLEKINY